MSEATGKDPRRPTGARDKKSKSQSKLAGRISSPRSKSSGEVGKALRSVYDTTLSERVPDDFLDLLGKLS